MRNSRGKALSSPIHLEQLPETKLVSSTRLTFGIQMATYCRSQAGSRRSRISSAVSKASDTVGSVPQQPSNCSPKSGACGHRCQTCRQVQLAYLRQSWIATFRSPSRRNCHVPCRSRITLYRRVGRRHRDNCRMTSWACSNGASKPTCTYADSVHPTLRHKLLFDNV